MIANVPVSIGELLDKITILEIKETRIIEEDKLVNVRKELNYLRTVCETLQLNKEPNYNTLVT